MIRQFAALKRMKELREEKLQLAVEAKRRELRQALALHQQAVMAAQENARMLPEREKAIYAELIGRVEKPNRFEIAKEKVQRLEAEQQQLEDQARHLQAEAETRGRELEQLRLAHRRTQIERDKYQTTMQELELEARLLSEAKEESEQEEAASTRFTAIA